jgi:hypothetical protein
VAERSFPRTIALIGLVGTLGGAAITGFFTLAANDHTSPPPQPPVTTPVSSSPASPVVTGSLVASQTPAAGSATSSAAPTAATQGATVTGVPRRIASGQQLTLHGSGFPRGGSVRVTFATYPGEDYQVSSAQADAQGSFTVTISSVLLSTVCGYDGHLNTWDDSGDQVLLTSTPLTVAC